MSNIKIIGYCQGWEHYVCGKSENISPRKATHIYKGKKLCDIHYRIATGNLGRNPEPFDPDET